MKKIEEYTDGELDSLELNSYRGIEQAQAQLHGFQQNIVAIRQERERRKKENTGKDKAKK